MRGLIEKGDLNYVHFLEVLQWALKTETIYKNKRQKGIKGEEQIKQSQMNALSNPFSCVAHKQSKENVEKFFTDKRLSLLFRKYAP